MDSDMIVVTNYILFIVNKYMSHINRKNDSYFVKLYKSSQQSMSQILNKNLNNIIHDIDTHSSWFGTDDVGVRFKLSGDWRQWL